MRKVAVIALALVTAGCATILRGTTQIVTIDTPGADGAVCSLSTSTGAQVVQTPGPITVPRAPTTIPFHCAKQCFQNKDGFIPASFEATTAGNLIAGGLVGVIVDSQSGASNRYPDQISILMTPDQSCAGGRTPPGEKR